MEKEKGESVKNKAIRLLIEKKAKTLGTLEEQLERLDKETLEETKRKAKQWFEEGFKEEIRRMFKGSTEKGRISTEALISYLLGKVIPSQTSEIIHFVYLTKGIDGLRQEVKALKAELAEISRAHVKTPE